MASPLAPGLSRKVKKVRSFRSVHAAVLAKLLWRQADCNDSCRSNTPISPAIVCKATVWMQDGRCSAEQSNAQAPHFCRFPALHTIPKPWLPLHLYPNPPTIERPLISALLHRTWLATCQRVPFSTLHPPLLPRNFNPNANPNPNHTPPLDCPLCRRRSWTPAPSLLS